MHLVIHRIFLVLTTTLKIFKLKYCAMQKGLLYIVLGSILLLAGCATPNYETVSKTKVISPDAQDNLGGTGIESDDVRTIATRMTSSLMSVPSIYAADGPVRIAISPVRNSTRFMIDTGIFTTRLRAEMNQISQGRVRFFGQGMAEDERSEILWQRDRALWEEETAIGAGKMLGAVENSGVTLPATIAVIEPENRNVEDINAQSILAMVRNRMAAQSRNVRFLSREQSGRVTDALLNEGEARDLGLIEGGDGSPSSFSGADYFLTGDLTAESLASQASADVGSLNEALVFNLSLVNTRTGAVESEIPLSIKSRVSSGLGEADLILTGEMRGLSKASGGGDRSDYILMSFQLIDPVTNELVWEDIYETKKVTRNSVIYK